MWIAKESNHIFVKNPGYSQLYGASLGVYSFNSNYPHGKRSRPFCSVVESLFLKKKKERQE